MHWRWGDGTAVPAAAGAVVKARVQGLGRGGVVLRGHAVAAVGEEGRGWRRQQQERGRGR